jgi:hypothetical protein
MGNSGSVYELSILLSLQDRASVGLDKFEKKLHGLGGTTAKYAGTLGHLSKLHNEVFDPIARVSSVWKNRIDSLEDYTDAYMRLLRAQGKFEAINLSPSDNAKAFDAVRKNVQSLGGLSLTDTTTAITTLHTALGSLDEAIEALPLATKYEFGFKAKFGDQYSTEEIEKQTDAAFRFLEVTGKVAKGRAEMEKYFNVMVQMQTARAGKVSPTELFDFARMGSPAAQGLSVEGLRHMQSVLMELKGAGAGTALLSGYRAMVTGVTPQYAAEEFSRLGLVDKNKVQFGKAQKIKRILPGGNKLAEPFMRDPLEAADMLMGAMKTHGINTADDNAVRAELGLLFQKSTAFRMMSLLTTQRNQVLKESGLAEKSTGVDELNKQALDSAQGKLEQYKASVENFRAGVGKPLVEVGTQLATKALPFFQWMSDHPNWSLGLIVGGKALGGIAETATILGTSKLFSFFSNSDKGARGLGDSLVVAEKRTIGFTSAWQKSTPVVSDAIKSTESKLSGLKGKLTSLTSSPFTVALKLTVAGMALEKLLELKDEYDKREADRRDFAKSSGESFADYKSRQRSNRLLGIDTSGDDSRGLAQKAVEAINRKQELESALMPEKFGGFWGHAWTADRPYGSRWNVFNTFDPDKAGGIFRHVAPMLDDPKVMRQAFAQLGKLGLTPQATPDLYKSLQKEFPVGFSKAWQEYQKEIEGLRQPTQQATEGFQNLSQQLIPTNQYFGQLQSQLFPLPSSFSNLGGAATSLTDSFNNSASRLNNVPLPSGGVQPSPTPTPAPIPSLNLLGKNTFEYPPSKLNTSALNAGLARGLMKGGDTHVHITYSPKLEIKGDGSSPQQFAALLEEHAHQLTNIVEARLSNRIDRYRERGEG